MAGPTRPWAHELPESDPDGAPDDERLAVLYSGAHALLSPPSGGSAVAGLEALACGTPVVACDSPAVREVLGDRASFVAPATWRP